MDRILEIIWAKKIVFLGTFFLVFTITYIVLLAIDFLPESPTPDDSVQEVASKEMEGDDIILSETTEMEKVEETNSLSSYYEPEFPVQIVIEKLGKTILVENPMSRTISDLDAALLNGAVRHPDSATLTQEGNVFILGHSSYLPNVFNKNFQAFNGIQNLEWGDIIEVYSEESIFKYRVEKVYRASAQDITVPIAGEGHLLTLATCNSFGSVDDRYIVEAKQIDTKKL